ncbi:hypothetical protein jhhlp_007440 [Lomentospora prolificans]|uniref:Ketoreductase (KR) domain-containing protein n=1 Tax=Lomentospora prolificans TaxID=41688 RepID=A0A2N3N114_9PEZI|nr:hypothetical protein jhhlp_007440 [Lomentospora prolificans]
MAQLTWLITATTSGLGVALFEHLVSRGGRIIATGRGAERRLAHLKSDNVAVLDLDVTSSQSTIVRLLAPFSHFSRLVRLTSLKNEEFTRDLFNVNFFGTLQVTQQRGTIAFTGAGPVWAPLPFLSHYAASKAALTIFGEALSKEVSAFDIRCVVFGPGGFVSQLGVPRKGSAEGFAVYQPAIDDYKPLFREMMKVFATEIGPNIPGDVNKLSECIVDSVKGEGLFAGRPSELRVILGPDSLSLIQQKCREQLKLVDEGEPISLSTDSPSQKGRGSDIMGDKGLYQ